uniref:Glucose methanol choline oxidoreductase atC n=1 Tax=Aspergillus terreus (strain NIH 2624 / FGSC A1156) TaxID=341663 RepID=ATC_ASPTN|nr:glucose-methanol-choline oxidoreductase [Aspergillus terreus]
MRVFPTYIAVSGLFGGAFAAFGATNIKGQTKLFGTSFGILAKNASYDYVIVGGGTAGLTVAARLAAQPNVSVAVIEAGSFYEIDNGNISQVPGYGANYLSFNDLTPSPVLVDWGLITEPQDGLNNRQIHYSAGKTLGGSSALNDMIFHRATKGSYQRWAELVDDDTYTWDKLLPYLKKSVDFTKPKDAATYPYDASVYSPEGGPLQVSFPNYRAPCDDFMETAFTKSGLKPIKGLNSGHLDGFAPTTFVINPADQTRSSSEAAFLQEALDTTAMTLYLRTLAKKILFDTNKTANGVLVETNGAEYTISAKKEVILSAGVFHSPQLLLLSGIGQADSLEKFGIPVISDLAGVGQNLWDHLFIFTSHEMNITTNSGVLVDPELLAEAVESYLNQQTGPLTGIGGGVVGWEKLPNRVSFSNSTNETLASFPDDFPEVEYVALAPGSNPASDPLANHFASVTAAVQSTSSRGYVKLRSADPHDAPIININALSHPADADLAVGAIKRLRQIAEATGVRVKEVLPGPEVVSDAEILEWVRNNAVNGYHASSTCAMGNSSNPDAVVDTRAKVYGVSNLRVVDASALPYLPPGHPMSSIYAFAELIAEDILSK